MIIYINRGVYLTDLTFIEDGNKDFIGHLINFRKRELVSGIVAEVIIIIM